MASVEVKPKEERELEICRRAMNEFLERSEREAIEVFLTHHWDTIEDKNEVPNAFWVMMYKHNMTPQNKLKPKTN